MLLRRPGHRLHVRPPLLVPVLGLVGALTLTGCSTARTEALTAEALADEVAALYPPAGDTRVDVRCDGPLAGEVGATQDCRVAVRRDVATVRATVTEETDDGPVFEAVPVVAAADVAQTVLDGLVRGEYVVGEVACEGELLGVVGEEITCRATPPGDGRPTSADETGETDETDGAPDAVEVVATVRKVVGLDVRLRYRLVG